MNELKFMNEMMKKLIIVALLAVPCAGMAQSEWEVPDAVKQQQKTEQVAKTEKEVKAEKTIDAKYAKGTVPVVDGKVVWKKTIKVDGMDAGQVYERTLAALTELTKQPQQREDSRITAVNQKQHIIAGLYIEEIVFSSSTFSRDATDFRYTIIATCKDGKVELELCRISFDYEKGRETHSTFTAEESITDEVALNRKGTKIYRGYRKFRMRAIDRKDQVFEFLESKIK